MIETTLVTSSNQVSVIELKTKTRQAVSSSFTLKNGQFIKIETGLSWDREIKYLSKSD